jgi:hypothetical protein
MRRHGWNTATVSQQSFGSDGDYCAYKGYTHDRIIAFDPFPDLDNQNITWRESLGQPGLGWAGS